MSKPENYKGADALSIKCLRDYTVKTGTDDPTLFEKGKTYSVSPGSHAHLMRKTYALHDTPLPGRPRGKYLGDVPFFADPKIEAEQAQADQAAKIERDARDPDGVKAKAKAAAAAAKAAAK